MSRHIGVSVMAMLLIAGVWGSALAQTEEEMLAMCRDVSDALNAHDLDRAVMHDRDDVVWDNAGVVSIGKEAVRAAIAALFEAFPDFYTTEGLVLASDNIVLVEHAAGGTHQGPFMGIPATGKSLLLPHIDIYEFEGGQIVKITTYADNVSVMVQLGLMPASELPPLVPSFTLPDPEPTGLSPLEAYAEQTARWNSTDASYWAKMIHPDADLLVAALGIPLDRDAYIASQELYTLGMSDRKQENVRVVDLGDGWVFIDIVFTGTNDGPYFGIPATGRPFEVRAGQVSRFDAEGLLTYQHTYFDNLTLFIQLGLVPAPEPSSVSPASWGEIKAKFR